jgi:hypothetical protein
MHEAGELIRRAAIRKGYVAMSEYQVHGKTEDLKRRKIDWVWIDRNGKLVAAFEIEGSDVGPQSVQYDVRKLMRMRIRHRFIVVYGMRLRRKTNGRTCECELNKSGHTIIKKEIGKRKIRFVSEAALLKRGSLKLG